MRGLEALDRKIDALQTKQQRLYAKARNARINRAKKMFLNAKWLLDENLELCVTDMKLAKALCALEKEVGTDFGFGGEEEPWSLLYSFTFDTDGDDADDEKLTGEISCELDDHLWGRTSSMAPLLVIRPILEKLIPYFKNLQTNLPTISYKIAEASMELDKLLALVRKHNKYRRKEK
jgi:hypothetical protein